ncbi:hypothetical protein GFK09_25430, partial [Salmonella enterica subsp. enterica serovar Enteritidis]|nr:hypothetical protein [Salmonella enterica subsp. enterica serovar Enteritidis]
TNGKPLALGTVLSLKNNDGVIQSTSIVGEDGQAYVSGCQSSPPILILSLWAELF